ncbi:MAG: RcapMu34 [Herminiimonas sp.]|nr:RcapMu34 [Herminiimonas sp.]
MAALGTKLRAFEYDMVMFYCPGCDEAHTIRARTDAVNAPRPSWTFNGNGDAPTFTPSILVTGMQTIKDANGEWTGEWVRDADGKGVKGICHSFVTDGRIQFLTDCTHALAGQTVDLPDYPGDE